LRLGLGCFFGIYPTEGEEENKHKGEREKEKGRFSGVAGSFQHGGHSQEEGETPLWV
jgi:hypothetical protein